MKGKKSAVASPCIGTAPRRGGRSTSIVFACDAGMGSSAMGASVLRKKIQDAGHSRRHGRQQGDRQPRRQLRPGRHPPGPDRAGAASGPRRRCTSRSTTSWRSPRYDEIVELIDQSNAVERVPADRDADRARSPPGRATCCPEQLDRARGHGADPGRRDHRGRPAAGRVRAPSTPAYVDARCTSARSRSRPFMGNGLAIPHGTNDAKASIRRPAACPSSATTSRSTGTASRRSSWSASPVPATTTWRCCRGSPRCSWTPTRWRPSRLRDDAGRRGGGARRGDRLARRGLPMTAPPRTSQQALGGALLWRARGHAQAQLLEVSPASSAPAAGCGRPPRLTR